MAKSKYEEFFDYFNSNVPLAGLIYQARGWRNRIGDAQAEDEEYLRLMNEMQSHPQFRGASAIQEKRKIVSESAGHLIGIALGVLFYSMFPREWLFSIFLTWGLCALFQFLVTYIAMKIFDLGEKSRYERMYH